MIKQYGTYIGVLIFGLILGYFIFGGSKSEKLDNNPVTSESKHAWTCSMHPQVKKTEKGNCPLCGMDLIPSDVSVGELENHQFQMSENAVALAGIRTVSIGLEELRDNNLTLSGTIKSNEKTDGVQTTVFDGRMEKLNVKAVGDYVKKGQIIGYIYSPELYLAQDKLLTSSSYKETHQKLYDAARNSLGLWKMTDEQIDEVLRKGKPMMSFPIYADVSGTVIEIAAEEGDWYQQGDPLFKVANLYTVWAVFDAYENQIPFLGVGQDIKITSAAFKGETLNAKVSFIEPILDVSKRTASVRSTLVNKKGLLKPGMFIEGSVHVKVDQQILTVPKSAVLWTGRRSVVYLKPNPNRPVFEMAEVTLGNPVGDSYIILDGLFVGDEVVVNGTFTLDAAAQLQGKKSMMTLKDTTVKKKTITDEKEALSYDGNFKNKFIQIIGTYVKLKDALVDTDAEKSMREAIALSKDLETVDLGMQNTMTQTHVQRIKKNIGIIANTNDVKKQREAFKPLSEDLVTIVSSFDNLNQPIYVQFCPMADNNKGATWISFQNKVLNPYFGEMMLTCGKVTRTIQ